MARRHARHATQFTEDHIKELMGDAKQDIEEKVDNANEFVQEKLEDAKAEIREKPFLYLAIAFGVGAAIGYIAHERMNRRD